MTNKTEIVIVGYGNVGRGVYESIKRNSDMNLVGIITRGPERVAKELGKSDLVYQAENVGSWAKRLSANVAILCGGSKEDLPVQGPAFAKYYNTVDSFDTHADIHDYFKKRDNIAKSTEHTSVVCAGWDPGTFSVNRVLTDAYLPGTIPKAFYGLGEDGGLSMGHSDAVRMVKGVKDARQYTHAIPEAIERVRSGENPDLTDGEMHWRECFVVAEKGIDEAGKMKISEEITNMPNYFEPYKTKVQFVTQDELDKGYSSMPHDGLVLAVGETGKGNKATIEYKNVFESNPEATGNILVACARACHRMNQRGRRGAYTMLDVSPADLSPRSRDELLRKFM